MVWNRRKDPRTQRGVPGRVNPPSQWVWSQRPTHEPLVTRELFEAASTTGRFRQGSRPGASPNTHPQTTRTYVMRSYLFCHLCARRMWDNTKMVSRNSDERCVYYHCKTNPQSHAHLPWYAEHPHHISLRECAQPPPY